MPRTNIGVSERELEIRADIRQTMQKNQMTLAECAAYMSVSLNTAKARLAGVRFQPYGRTRRYMIADVAHRLAETEVLG